MKHGALLLAATGLAWMAGPVAAATQLDKDDWLIFGRVGGAQQPDGNSIVMTGPKGAVVFDTGRHKAQSDAIEQLLRETNKPLVAIVNSHWHLDHVSGNPRLKAVYPGVQVWASNAINEALTGFLKRGADDDRAAIAENKEPAAQLDERRIDLATVEAGDRLKPDHVVTGTRMVTLAGRRFELHLARRAATEGDVWLYDSAHKRAVVGDLVTFPAPFLDTACPKGWKAALADVAATPFTSLIPGHGPVMDRAAFAAWRGAFSAFVDCSEGDAALETCTAGWAAYARTVDLAGAGIDGRDAAAYADYYAGLLRSHKLDVNCGAGTAA